MRKPAMNRRQFLGWGAATLGATVTLPRHSVMAASMDTDPPRWHRRQFIDANVTLGEWPFRNLPLSTTRALVKKLKGIGVSQAWAGSFEGILHQDLNAANGRLVDQCRSNGGGLLIPFGTINPMLPGWKGDLERCLNVWRMTGLRLYPNYHGYDANSPEFLELLDVANDKKVLLQIVVSVEDERTQHPLLRVDHVSVSRLPGLLESRPGLRIMLLNWGRGVPRSLLPPLTRTGRVYLDIATVEGVAGLRTLLDLVPLSSVVFGTHAPFFYLQSSLLKLQESDLTAAELQGIRSRSAAGALND